ncbi:curli production assembly/transport protein CsgE [Kushneria pakistanensis]
MDRTITLPGNVFYRAFSRAAMGNPIFNTAALAVMERPDPRRGSQIWIAEGSHIHFQTRLSPRINDAGNTAQGAVDIVQKALLTRRIGAALSSDQDLGKEELQP